MPAIPIMANPGAVGPGKLTSQRGEPWASEVFKFGAGKIFALWCVASLHHAQAADREAYIWQRAWSPNLEASVLATADIVQRWHVLFAYAGADGSLQSTGIAWPVLLQTGRSITPVIRLSAALPPAAVVAKALANLPAAARNSLEIDFDSATAQLSAYRRFLQSLHVVLPPATHLSATMLPDWLNSPDFQAFSHSVQSLVLQVHAVDKPARGLFDPIRSLAWVRRMDRLTRAPFTVAIPDYTLRVQFAANQTALAEEADMPSAMPAGAETIAAAPGDVATFLAALAHENLKHCTGIVWFRLPLQHVAPGRTLATWGMATWRQVALGTPLKPHLAITRVPAPPPAPASILLRNLGNIDVLIPQTIPVPACAFFDGIAPYRRAGEALFAETRPWLRPSQTLQVGWARCAAPW